MSPDLSAKDSLEQHDAALTESPYLPPQEYCNTFSRGPATPPATPVRSKSYESAVVNLSSNLPLPSSFYQHHPWRTTYSDLLPKHVQFATEYIYAFNWEDPAVDLQILDLSTSDVLVTITSAGDNILDYLSQSRVNRVHAIDLNPNQNHLLELKCACFAAQLPYSEIWSLFGEGTHASFRSLLIQKLSPHLSSNAFQFWLSSTSVFSPSGRGLYASSGGSRHAIRLCRWLFRCTSLAQKVRTLCTVSTLAEQKEIWYNSVRRVLLSWPLHQLLISTEWWAWRAAGVPPEQRALIVNDYAAKLPAETRDRLSQRALAGEAVFKYLEDTLDPVVNHTLLSRDNYFYHLVLQGKHSRSCAPQWLGERAWRRLSRNNAERLDNLRIHTDEFLEVVKRMRGGSVGAVIIMDSMDWLEVPTPTSEKHVKFSDKHTKHDRARSQSKSRSTEGEGAAQTQIEAIHRVLKVGGKVLLRSAALKPWYVDLFEQMEDEETGKKVWSVKCMGRRENGKCLDRVNMYASCWLLVKIGEITPTPSLVGSPRMKSALKRRRTGSENFSSGSENGDVSPNVLRGRPGRKNTWINDSAIEEIDVKRRGILEDIMLPGAAMDGDDGERF